MFVYGIFRDEKLAARAVEALIGAEFCIDEISALMHEGPAVQELHAEQWPTIPRGAAIGAALGALGGLVVVPVAGWLAFGPVLAALSGALTGGAAGTFVGGLAGFGRPRSEVDFAHHHLKQGAVLVGVNTIPARRQAAEAALVQAGADAIHAGPKAQAAREALAP